MQGQIETKHPGYLGAQDTSYVGTIKGVGRIYQQIFLDTYTKVVFVKLYDHKHALVVADLLNDRLLPFFEQQAVSLLGILTDRGRNTVVHCNIMNTNAAWQLRRSTTPRRKPTIHKPLAFANVSTVPFRMSSMPLHFVSRLTLALNSYRPIGMNGLSATTTSAFTVANTALDADLGRPSRRPNIWHKSSNWIHF